jgi:hypothetical protein
MVNPVVPLYSSPTNHCVFRFTHKHPTGEDLHKDISKRIKSLHISPNLNLSYKLFQGAYYQGDHPMLDAEHIP